MLDKVGKVGKPPQVAWDTKVLKITPELAAQLLEKNFKNRNVRPSRVTAFAGMMKRGEWRVTPDGCLCIAPNGRLLNGQHRLMAVIEAGVTVEFVVAFNVPEDLYPFMDRGLARTAADALHLSPSLVELSRMLIVLATGSTSPTDGQIMTVSNEVAADLDELLDGASRRGGGFGTAPVKAAAVLRMRSSGVQGRLIVKESYRDLVNRNHAAWTGALAAFAKTVENKKLWHTAGHPNRRICAAIAWRALDPKVRNGNLRIGSINIELACAEMAKLITPMLDDAE